LDKQKPEQVRLAPHPRTFRKAREQVKTLVSDQVSPARIKDYLQKWARWWGATRSRVWELFLPLGTKPFMSLKVKPAIELFLQERGLRFSQEKTKITHVEEGFNFLGFNVRKYTNGKLLIKPAKESVTSFLGDIREVIKQFRGDTTERLISTLNPKLRGWAYYYRHSVAKEEYFEQRYLRRKKCSLDHWAQLTAVKSIESKRWKTR
jgi:RNA-directed DNA polymerase